MNMCLSLVQNERQAFPVSGGVDNFAPFRRMQYVYMRKQYIHSFLQMLISL